MTNTFTETWHSLQREPTRLCCEWGSPAHGWVRGGSPLLRGCQQGKLPVLNLPHPPGGWVQIPTPGSQLPRVTLKSPYSPKPTCHPPLHPTLRVLWQVSWTTAAVNTGPTNAGVEPRCRAQVPPAICGYFVWHLLPLDLIFSCVLLCIFCIVDSLKNS